MSAFAVQAAAAFAAVGLWAAWIGVKKGRPPGGFAITTVPGIWVQPLAQGAIFVYWSFYCAPVIANLPAIVVQLLFACAVDAVSNWRSRDQFLVSTSNLPLIFSLNLFLWHDDAHLWISLAIVAFAVLSKSVFRWKEKGWAHIFNPTGIALAAAGLVYYAIGQEYWRYIKLDEALIVAPNTSEVILFAAMLVQWRFGTAVTTFGGVVGMLLATLLFWAIGLQNRPSPFEAQPFIGLTLLMTDPASSPRSGKGRVVYGIAWGVLFVTIQVALINGIGHAYDYFPKIFATPLANLLAPGCDRLARRWKPALPAFLPAPESPFWPRAAMAAIVALFLVAWSPKIKTMAYEDDQRAEYKLAHPSPIQKVSADGRRFYCADNPVYCRPFSFREEWALWRQARREGRSEITP